MELSATPILQKHGTLIIENQLALEKKFLCLQRWILNCGKDLRREKIIRIIWFITTGIGSGIGEACNNGTHEVDCCRWFLGVDYPTKVVSAGGRYAFKDDWQTPDTQVASFEFGDAKSISWESRSCNIFPVEGAGRGFIIYGDKGSLVNLGGGDYKIFDEKNKLVKEVKPDTAADPTNPISATGNLDLYHFENFVKTIRGEATLNSPVDEASKSVLLCHLANISQRTGNALHCDTNNGHIINDDSAMKLWRREYELGWEPRVS
jgi:predicted dehydrogenase